MALDRQLARWVDAGLIASDQASAITAFEREQSRPTFLYAIAGLGGLAIAIGLISIVASNWAEIPGHVKLAIDLLAVAALGQAVVRFHVRNQAVAREVGVLVLYGLVLASIALIGQVYQLGGKTHMALLSWSVLTAWLMTRGHSGILAFLWVIGLQGTYMAVVAEYADDDSVVGLLLIASFYWTSLGLLFVGRSDWLRERRPRFARVLQGIAWAELVFMGCLGSMAFYESTHDEAEYAGLWMGLTVSAALTALIARTLSATSANKAWRNVLIACLVFSHVPILISPGDLDVLAALCFIGLWFLVALAAYRSGSSGVLNLATAMIGIRVLVIYFEVFGSLLGTGLGLISGGGLTLAGLWYWMRKRWEFAEQFAAGAGGPASGSEAPPGGGEA